MSDSPELIAAWTAFLAARDQHHAAERDRRNAAPRRVYDWAQEEDQ